MRGRQVRLARLFHASVGALSILAEVEDQFLDSPGPANSTDEFKQRV
jgi:hypothetical protein